jgi:hypothetical protein
MNATARTWHPPLIYDYDDYEISPPAGQLKMPTGLKTVLRRRNPEKATTWREAIDHYKREKKLNAEAQGRWRNKDPTRGRCTVEYEGYVLDGLVKLGRILDNETGDAKIIGEALSEIIAELLTPEAVTELLRQARAKSW